MSGIPDPRAAVATGQHTRVLAAPDVSDGWDQLTAGRTALEVHGHLALAREHFMRAADEADTAGDGELLGQAVLGWSGLWVHENRGVVDAIRVQTWRERALRQLSPSSPTARRLAVRMAAEDDYNDGAVGRVERSLVQARTASDPLLLGESLALCHHCMLGPEHATARRLIADELVAHGATRGRGIDLLMGLTWRTVDLLLCGDPHADRALSELERLASDPDHLATLYLVRAVKVMHMIRSGRLEEAEEAAAACFEQGEQVGDADALGWYGAQLCSIRWYQGRSAELVPVIADLVASETMASTNDAYLAALAVATGAGGESEAAASALRRLRGSGLAALRSSSTWMVSMMGAAIAAHALHDRDVASEVRDLLAPYADLPVMASLGVACFGAAHYPLALCALTLEDRAGARRHLEKAVRHDQMLGNLPAARLAQQLLDAQHVLVPGTLTSALTAPVTDPVTDPIIGCELESDRWRVSMGERRAVVPDCVGMRYLAVLVATPGREVRATELAGRPSDSLSDEPVLDSRAVAAYRRRAEQLQEEMADAADDEVRLDTAQREYDALMDELMRTRGLGGRTRRFVGSDERARTAVQKALRRAVTKIRAGDQVIADIIEQHLLTGYVCCYRREAVSAQDRRTAGAGGSRAPRSR